MFPSAGINGQQIRRDASRFRDLRDDHFPLCRRKVPVLVRWGFDPWCKYISTYLLQSTASRVKGRQYLRYLLHVLYCTVRDAAEACTPALNYPSVPFDSTDRA